MPPFTATSPGDKPRSHEHTLSVTDYIIMPVLCDVWRSSFTGQPYPSSLQASHGNAIISNSNKFISSLLQMVPPFFSYIKLITQSALIYYFSQYPANLQTPQMPSCCNQNPFTITSSIFHFINHPSLPSTVNKSLLPCRVLSLSV